MSQSNQDNDDVEKQLRAAARNRANHDSLFPRETEHEREVRLKEKAREDAKPVNRMIRTVKNAGSATTNRVKTTADSVNRVGGKAADAVRTATNDVNETKEVMAARLRAEREQRKIIRAEIRDQFTKNNDLRREAEEESLLQAEEDDQAKACEKRVRLFIAAYVWFGIVIVLFAMVFMVLIGIVLFISRLVL